MLSELWDYFTTCSTREARSEGYLYHSIALAHRARRCQKYWESHLKHCHKQIAKMTEGEHVVVLGSGLLLETPLEILAKKFSRITLVDAVHTKEARSKVEHFLQIPEVDINLVELDLNKSFFNEKADQYISANILSQIAYVPMQKWIKEKVSDSEIEKRAHELQARHLEQLTMISSSGLLFSDFEMQILSPENVLLETKPTVSKEPHLNWKKQWNWDLAPAPELSKDYSVRLIVGCRTFHD